MPVQPFHSYFSCCRPTVLFLLLFSVAAISSWAQDSEHRSPDSFSAFVELVADIAGDETEEEWGSEQMENLYELFCHPLNLNDLHEEALAELPFLTQVQLADLVDYATAHRPLLSTGELMSLTSLDYTSRRLLQLFCYAGPVPRERLTLKDVLHRSSNDLSLRTDLPFYTRMGFAQYPASVLSKSPNKVYQGSQPYVSMRYAMQSVDKFEAGLQLEKDAGESGVDYWSAYALLRRVGIVRTLAVGDYRLSFGQGLVVNTGSGLGKLSMLSSIGRMDRGIRRHSSMQESGYKRGIAATIRLNSHFEFSSFFSHRNVDGTLLADSSGVSTIRTDGLHRTQSEIRRKGNLTQTDWGGNLSFQGRHLRLSATFVQTHFSLPLSPRHDTPSTLYRLYNAAGSDFTAFSLAYRYIGRVLTFTGETASTHRGGIATLAALQTEFSGHRLTLVGRYYSADYAAINGQSFGQTGRPQNESGVYAGWHHDFSRHVSIDAYADYVHFPWLRYRVSRPSDALEGVVQLSYIPSSRHLLNLRYRLRTREQDYRQGSSTDVVVQQHDLHALRLMHVWQLSAFCRLKTLLSGTLSRQSAEGSRVGWAWAEDLSLHPADWLRLSLFTALFHTADYSTRIYLYEPSLFYTFGMTSFYDRGIRAALLATLRFPKQHIEFLAKMGLTSYFRKAEIGTGLDLIPQSHREDLQLQLLWHF